MSFTPPLHPLGWMKSIIAMLTCFRPTVLAAFCLLLTAGMARAEYQQIDFQESTRWTFIWCAVLLAAGMIISAIILKNRDK
jgi:uncharacterized membrane protein YvlD (DUF360 family)